MACIMAGLIAFRFMFGVIGFRCITFYCAAPRLRHRIDATTMERVALAQPAHSEPAAAPESKTLDCLISIMGTRRVEAA